jgi:hypothetical protein
MTDKVHTISCSVRELLEETPVWSHSEPAQATLPSELQSGTDMGSPSASQEWTG